MGDLPAVKPKEAGNKKREDMGGIPPTKSSERGGKEKGEWNRMLQAD